MSKAGFKPGKSVDCAGADRISSVEGWDKGPESELLGQAPELRHAGNGKVGNG